MTPQRLDQALLARGLAASRARAQDLIRQGAVRVDGQQADKPATPVTEKTSIEVAADANPYVSRGGLKLAHALRQFGFEAAGRVALDIGASTGGFTEVLLGAGASRIYAVDVGHGQFHERLRNDHRVTLLEKTDACALGDTLVPDPVSAIVADVSFISLTLALPAALRLATPGAWLIALIKPQFEAGRAAVGKGGIVRSADDRQAAVAKVRAFLDATAGWRVIDVIASPITGGDGNEEFLLGAVHAP